MKKLLMLTFLVLSLTSQAPCVPLDFNKDGISEFIVINENKDSTLTWTIYRKDKRVLDTATSFGTAQNLFIPGYWVSNIPLLGLLQNSSSLIQWRIRRHAASYEIFELSAPNDVLVSGSDFDGDKFTDAATITRKGNALYWRIHFSPLMKKMSKLHRLGSAKDIPFFLNTKGIRDSLAVLRGGNKILLRDALTRKQSKIVLASTFSSRPLPVQQHGGADVLVFTTRSDTATTVTAVNLAGAVIRETAVQAAGDVLVGEYIASASGEEIAIRTDTGFSILNPVTGAAETVSIPSGDVIDDITIQQFTEPPATCLDESRNPSDGNEGFLWKPVSESTGKLAVHTPKALTGRIAYAEIADPNGTILERGVYGGSGNGGRELFRFSKAGSGYANNSAAVITMDAGCRIMYTIPDSSKRWD